MTLRYWRFVQALGFGVALGLAPAIAQDDTTDITTLIELAANAAAQDVVALPGSQLAGILSDADGAQRTQLIAQLSDGDRDMLLTTLALSGASPALLADMVSAIITLNPDATDRMIEIILQNVAPAILPEIAESLYELIERLYAEMSRPILSGHVLAALAFDSTLSERLIRSANAWERQDAETLALVLVDIAERDDAVLASAIETALALEGGQMLELGSALRAEVPVAALPEAPAAAALTPAVPPADIGGGGASPGGSTATTPGSDAVFAASGSAGTGLGGGPSFSRRPTTGDVSPTN